MWTAARRDVERRRPASRSREHVLVVRGTKRRLRTAADAYLGYRPPVGQHTRRGDRHAQPDWLAQSSRTGHARSSSIFFTLALAFVTALDIVMREPATR